MNYTIIMRHKGEETLVMENVNETEVDSLVKTLNALNDAGEVYFKRAVTAKASSERKVAIRKKKD